jgi:hypothetical protein
MLLFAVDTTPPLWLWIVLTGLPTIAAVIAVRQTQHSYDRKEEENKRIRDREREDDRREQNRREDQLWGYVDSQGIRHVGVVETVGTLQAALERFGTNVQTAKEIVEQNLKNDPAADH